MKIQISPEALNWYKRELGVSAGDYIRFFARYGGCSTVQKGFSLGISDEHPIVPAASETIDGIHFFIENNDIWYFDGHDLQVDMNEQLNEPVYLSI